MTAKTNTGSGNNAVMIFLWVSISILFLHFYRCCPMLFGVIPKDSLVDNLLGQFTKLGLFDGIFETKLVALALYFFYVLLREKKNKATPNWGPAAYCAGVGLFLYFVSVILIDPGLSYESLVSDVLYAVLCLAGFFLSVSGITRIYLFLTRSLRNDDVFNKEGTSFPQEQRLIETNIDHS